MYLFCLVEKMYLFGSNFNKSGCLSADGSYSGEQRWSEWRSTMFKMVIGGGRSCSWLKSNWWSNVNRVVIEGRNGVHGWLKWSLMVVKAVIGLILDNCQSGGLNLKWL